MSSVPAASVVPARALAIAKLPHQQNRRTRRDKRPVTIYFAQNSDLLSQILATHARAREAAAPAPNMQRRSPALDASPGPAQADSALDVLAASFPESLRPGWKHTWVRCAPAAEMPLLLSFVLCQESANHSASLHAHAGGPGCWQQQAGPSRNTAATVTQTAPTTAAAPAGPTAMASLASLRKVLGTRMGCMAAAAGEVGQREWGRASGADSGQGALARRGLRQQVSGAQGGRAGPASLSGADSGQGALGCPAAGERDKGRWGWVGAGRIACSAGQGKVSDSLLRCGSLI